MPLASLERELVGADPVAAPTTPIKDSDHSEDPNIPAIATTTLAKMQLLLLWVNTCGYNITNTKSSIAEFPLEKQTLVRQWRGLVTNPLNVQWR